MEMDNIRRGAQQLEEEAARCDGDVAVLRNDIYHNKENTARIEEEIRLSAEGDSRIEEDIAARQEDIRGKREAIARAEAEQLALFTDYAEREKREQADQAAHARERKLQEAMLGIKKRYGKNAILKGMNLEDGATAKERNQTIGGHQA